MKYRAEIDGLRALAVLVIVFFHFKVVTLSGGFVGVDVFFVISGYLIARIIINELKRNEFTFVNFYVRRAKRIIPALVPVLVVVSIFAWYELLPNQLNLLSKSILSTIFFVSNFFFLKTSEYFGHAADELHLLHTWSLAVEEQYYLLFPLFMFLLWKWNKKHILKATIIIASISLVGCIIIINYQYHKYQSATFYLLPTRGWELLAGALIALHPSLIVKQQKLASLCMLVGLSLIIFSTVFYTSEILFPGIAAIPPVLGAGLIIAGGQNAMYWIRGLLANPLMIGIGKISYSMYLWHWPLLVIFLNSFDGKAKQAIWLFFPLLIISYLSYRFIEQPFRRSAFIGWKRLVGIIVPALLMVFVITTLLTKGILFRFSPEVAYINKFSEYPEKEKMYGGHCYSRVKWSKFPVAECMDPKEGRDSILIWGDSAGAHYMHGLKIAAKGTGIDILQASGGGCPAAVGYAWKKREICKLRNDHVLEYIFDHPPSLVVLTGQWNSHKNYKPYLERTIKSLRERDIKVVLLGPSIKYTARLPGILVGNMMKGYETESSDYLHPGATKVDQELLAGAVNLYGAKLISVYELLCDGLECPLLTPEGAPVQWDKQHLSAEGSVMLGKILFPLLQSELR